MIIHTALARGQRLFWAESSYEEKDEVKSAGFLWHGMDRCHPSCGACAAALEKVWWTYHVDAARALIEHADDDVRNALEGGATKKPAAAAEKKPAGKKVEVRGALRLAMLSALDDEKIKKIDFKGLEKKHQPTEEDIEDEDGYEDYAFNSSLEKAFDAIPITTAELAQLKALRWMTGIELMLSPQWDGEDEQFDLRSLDGIEHCVNLEILDLDAVDVKNVGPIAKLTKLRELRLSFRDKKPSVEPLKKLVGQLTRIDVPGLDKPKKTAPVAKKKATRRVSK
jgi:hypothetical protein